MSKGVEMLVNAVLKSVGVDPSDAMQKVESMKDIVFQSIKEINERVTRIEAAIDRIESKLTTETNHE